MNGPDQSSGFDFEFWMKVGDILDENDIVMDAMNRIRHTLPEHDQGLSQPEVDTVFDTVEHETL